MIQRLEAVAQTARRIVGAVADDIGIDLEKRRVQRDIGRIVDFARSKGFKVEEAKKDDHFKYALSPAGDQSPERYFLSISTHGYYGTQSGVHIGWSASLPESTPQAEREQAYRKANDTAAEMLSRADLESKYRVNGCMNSS